MHPNVGNYEYLEALYGSFTDASDATTSAPTTATDDGATAAPTMSSTIEATNGGRLLGEEEITNRKRRLESAMAKWPSVVSDHIHNLHQRQALRPGWRMLRQSKAAEWHEYRIDEAYAIRAYIVLTQ